MEFITTEEASAIHKYIAAPLKLAKDHLNFHSTN